MASRTRMPLESKAAETRGCVIDLAAARERQRLTRYRERAQAVLAQHRDALRQLFESGVVFTRHGSRVGRDLLQAHQNLMRVVDMASRTPADQPPGSATLAEGDSLCEEIEALLAKTSVIEERNKSLFQSTTPGSF